jgi:hypothetical protein
MQITRGQGTLGLQGQCVSVCQLWVALAPIPYICMCYAGVMLCWLALRCSVYRVWSRRIWLYFSLLRLPPMLPLPCPLPYLSLLRPHGFNLEIILHHKALTTGDVCFAHIVSINGLPYRLIVP